VGKFRCGPGNLCSRVGSGYLPSSYQGFQWANFGVVRETYAPGSGFDNGIVSGDAVAMNLGGRDAIVIQADSSFDFLSASFTAAWRDGLNITIDGYDDDQIIQSDTIVVNTPLSGIRSIGRYRYLCRRLATPA